MRTVIATRYVTPLREGGSVAFGPQRTFETPIASALHVLRMLVTRCNVSSERPSRPLPQAA